MQSPLCFSTIHSEDAAAAYGEQQIKASCARPLDELTAGEEKKKKSKKDTLSSYYVYMLRASDKPKSEDGSEKVERNAQVYQHSRRCRSETGTHTESHTSETQIKSTLLATAKWLQT